MNKTPQKEMLFVKDLKEEEIVILKLYQKLEFKEHTRFSVRSRPVKVRSWRIDLGA